MKNFKFLIIYIFVILNLPSCNKLEPLQNKIFDYDDFPVMILNSQQKKINNLYNVKFDDSFIDDQLDNPPYYFLKNWIDNNINIFGTKNTFTINVIDASVKRKEIENVDFKKYEEKIIYFYEISYLVEFILYDDNNIILANSIVESKRSTTSSKNISLNDLDLIINNLIYKCLMDFTNKAEELILKHFEDYIL